MDDSAWTSQHDYVSVCPFLFTHQFCWYFIIWCITNIPKEKHDVFVKSWLFSLVGWLNQWLLVDYPSWSSTLKHQWWLLTGFVGHSVSVPLLLICLWLFSAFAGDEPLHQAIINHSVGNQDWHVLLAMSLLSQHSASLLIVITRDWSPCYHHKPPLTIINHHCDARFTIIAKHHQTIIITILPTIIIYPQLTLSLPIIIIV